METTCYLIIIVFLLILAVVDLFVGVSNDAVNFMNSAIGANVEICNKTKLIRNYTVCAASASSSSFAAHASATFCIT